MNKHASGWSPPSDNLPSTAADLPDTDRPQVSSTGALQAAYDAHARQLVRVAFVLTGSAATAEDVVHDVFVQAANKIADVREPLPYLRTAVVNRCRSLHRRTKSAPLPERGHNTELDIGLIDLRDSLAALAPKQRTAIVLRYLCDLGDADIAATLGVRQATVRSLIFRGLRELRTAMSDTPNSNNSDNET